MWCDQSNEILEFFRSSFFAYAIVILVAFSPSCLAAKEFSAFRLQQFELHGTPYGSTGSLLNLETRIIPGSPIVASPRRCYVVKLADLSVAIYRDLLRHNVGGLVIVIPSDFGSLTAEATEQIQELEQVMLDEATSVPVYFIRESEEVLEMYGTVKRSAESLGSKLSATQSLIQFVIGNGVQLVSSLSTPKAMTDAQIFSVQGALLGSKSLRNFPILVSTHYDSMSPSAELSFGGDSNGSGTVALLELARVFSHLYSAGGSGHGGGGTGGGKILGRPYSSLLFLLSGAGHFNFQGTQKYLEDQIDSSDQSDLQETRLVVCLDSLAADSDHIYIHLSRSIREGTMLHTFIQNLKEAAQMMAPDLKVEVIQKKIRTENLLSWEHEKFHLKKINAITLTSVESPSSVKSSMLDTRDSVNVRRLALKTHVIAEALAASIYNVSGIGTSFSGSLAVSEESIDSMLDFVVSQPRSAQLLAFKNNKFVQSLRNLLARYTHETSLFSMKPDKRDANLVLYDSTSGVIISYDVKPAVFDLVLSLIIASYIGVIYLAIKNFPTIYQTFSSVSPTTAANGNGTHQKTNNKAQ